MKLGKYVEEVFSSEEMALISDQWLESSVQLHKINDLGPFIEMCEKQSENFKQAGPERKDDWEWGWAGNGITNESAEFPNIPYYFKNNTHVRIRETVYSDVSGYTEIKLLRMLQDLAFSKINLDRVSAIIEYGAGTGHNITYLKNKINKKFYAADWAQSAIEKLFVNKIVPNGHAQCVDYFNPKTFWAPSEKYIAFTNASLEQSSDRYEKFMQYLINDKNCIYGIHIEPIRELIEPNSELNRQSIAYAKNRNYLEGFNNYMKCQPIDLVEARDYGIGSKFISGYQMLIWTK